MSERKKITAIITEYRPNSHADVVVTKFLKGFPIDEGLQKPRVDVVSMYVDQFAENDLSRGIAAAHDVPIYPSIVKALTLGGGELAVDGVLLIGEHGDYAWNEKDQQLYPRKYFMEQICGVMATSGSAAPIFNDKHLSYNWSDAKWMHDRAAAVGAPFMAGSCIVVAWRSPWLEHENGVELEEAIHVRLRRIDTTTSDGLAQSIWIFADLAYIDHRSGTVLERVVTLSPSKNEVGDDRGNDWSLPEYSLW